MPVYGTQLQETTLSGRLDQLLGAWVNCPSCWLCFGHSWGGSCQWRSRPRWLLGITQSSSSENSFFANAGYTLHRSACFVPPRPTRESSSQQLLFNIFFWRPWSATIISCIGGICWIPLMNPKVSCMSLEPWQLRLSWPSNFMTKVSQCGLWGTLATFRSQPPSPTWFILP